MPATKITLIGAGSVSEDLYPAFRERLADMPPDFEPLSRRLMDAFRLYTATGDDHVGEYISFAWETDEMKGFDFDRYRQQSEEKKARLRQAMAVESSFKEYLDRASIDPAAQVIGAILNDKNQYEPALNVPNRGCILGLPDWAMVEVPAIVSGAGIAGPSCRPPSRRCWTICWRLTRPICPGSASSESS